MAKGGAGFQWGFANGQKFHVGGQQNRQFLLWHWLHTAFFTVNHWNGRAPVTLAANQPITQTVIDYFFAFALSFQPIGNGVDFEKRIAQIYQLCRSPKEIKEAFDALQEELQEQISDKMLKARTTLLENFDESVKQKLRSDLVEIRDSLDVFERTLWRLTRNYLADYADFNDANHSLSSTRLSKMEQSADSGTCLVNMPW